MAAKKTEAPEPRATPLEAGDPAEADALSQMGSTFAERAAAAKKDDKKPKKKAVQTAENKAVSKSSKK